MRRDTEGIAHGDAVQSEAFLQIFRKQQAASALGRGCQDHTVPETETVPDGKFRRPHKYVFGGLDQGEGVAPTRMAAPACPRVRFAFTTLTVYSPARV